MQNLAVAASLGALVIIYGIDRPAGASEPVGAAAYVRSLYAREAKEPGWHWQHSLSNRTRQLARLLQARYPGEAPPYIDSDWLCQCNDPGGIKLQSVSTTSSQSKRTTARAAFVFTSEISPSVNRITLLLVNEDGGWRVDDVIDKKGESLLADLQHALAHAKR